MNGAMEAANRVKYKIEFNYQSLFIKLINSFHLKIL